MKTKLLIAAILSLGVAGTAFAEGGISGGAVGSGNPSRDTNGTGSLSSADSSGREDNSGYLSGPHMRHFLRGGNRPIWHGMSRAHHRRHHG